MAILYPTLETILLANTYQPTDSEIRFIDFLKDNLSDEYEMFYKPMLNGDTPDIVLVKKTSGVLIFNILSSSINDYEVNGDSWYHTNEDGLRFELLILLTEQNPTRTTCSIFILISYSSFLGKTETTIQ